MEDDDDAVGGPVVASCSSGDGWVTWVLLLVGVNSVPGGPLKEDVMLTSSVWLSGVDSSMGDVFVYM